MSDVSGSGVKLISVTIVTPISFEGVVGFFWGGGGVGGGNVAGGGVSFSRWGRYKTWMRDRKPAKAWDRFLEVKR